MPRSDVCFDAPMRRAAADADVVAAANDIDECDAEFSVDLRHDTPPAQDYAIAPCDDAQPPPLMMRHVPI